MKRQSYIYPIEPPLERYVVVIDYGDYKRGFVRGSPLRCKIRDLIEGETNEIT